MIYFLWQPLCCRDSSPLSPDEHRHRQKRKDCHKHSEDAKGLHRAISVDPVSNEERPSKADDSTYSDYHHKAIPRYSIVCFNDLRKSVLSIHRQNRVSTYIVETNRWGLHQSECQHPITEFQPNPSTRRGILSACAKDPETKRGEC